MQHADQNWLAVILFELVIAAVILYKILSARRGKQMFIRRIPGLTAVEEAIGRATEMGRPVIMIPGLSGFDVVTLQALTIFSYITRKIARFGNAMFLPVCDAQVLTVAEEVIRNAYEAEGVPERFDPDTVRFLSERQFAYASGVAGTIQREKAAAIFMFGSFFAESLIFAESGNQVGAIQIAGTDSTTQVPFFIAACDYTIIGDEFYAASAYLSREPTLLGSLVGQDIGKLMIIIVIVLGVIAASIAPAVPESGLFGQLLQHILKLFNVNAS
ncbi:MAG: DUF6754 domain-containing protein [Armatimonadota bacterium]